MTLEFTRAAVVDLQSITTYTLERWGAEQEEIYLESLWSRFSEILADPGRWKFRHDLFPDCQIASHGKHLILFRSRDQTLQIVRILHGAMNLPRHIPKDLD